MFNRVKIDRRVLVVVGAFLLGAMWVVLMRSVLVTPPSTHYHANFAVYIDGQREQFDGFGYYQEITACTEDEPNNPLGRVHMHQPDSDVVHVHDLSVTWSNFFANLGWTLGDKVLATDTAVYPDSGKKLLRFVLNGHEEISVANRVIQNGDHLLVAYGNGDEKTLQTEYNSISDSGQAYNQHADPGTCSSGEAPSLFERIKHAVAE